MNLITFLLQTQAQPAAQQGSFWQQYSFIILMILIFVVMYFFMVRPQQKKQKEIVKWRESLRRGDKIVTVGGIYGTIAEVKDTFLVVEVDNNVRIRVDKSSVVKDITDAQNWKDRKEWLMLLLSLLLAFIVWLIHSLSLQYSVFLEYNVELNSTLQGRARSSVSKDVLIVRGKSDGYYILKQRIGRRKTLQVSASQDNLRHRDGDDFYVLSESIKSNIVEALGGSVDLEFIVTDSLDFTFPRITSKRVPVVPRSSVTFRPQYMSLGDMTIRPDSVDIYGDARLLETVDSVFTETISEKGVDGPIQGICDIVPIRRVSYSESAVYYSMNVVRYTEESLTVPVTVTGVPEDKDLIVLPSTVTLTFKRVFSSLRYQPEDFVLAVDYADFVRTIDSELVPELVYKPDGVMSCEITPRYVDCILLDRGSDGTEL